jgi:O-antigen biosynthesis protein
MGPPQLGPTGPLRIGFVVPRYGERVVGGAELLARWLAERLVGLGHSVEVLTTCGETHRGWENVLPPGVEQHGDITVRRFLVDPVEREVYLQILRAIDDGYPVSWEEELLWLRNGVASADMEQEIADHGDRYDLLVVIPYMFGPAYFTYALCPDKTVLIPCLHDERYARMAFVREMLQGSKGLLFNAYPEADLAERLAGPLAPWTVVCGHQAAQGRSRCREAYRVRCLHLRGPAPS